MLLLNLLFLLLEELQSRIHRITMEYTLLDVTTPGLVYICLGGFVVAFSMFSLLVKEKLYINEVVLGTAFGIGLGPYGADIFNPRSWSADSTFITREVMRVVLATGLFAIGVELPKSYMARHAKSLLVMVVPTMAIGWVIVADKTRGEAIVHWVLIGWLYQVIMGTVLGADSVGWNVLLVVVTNRCGGHPEDERFGVQRSRAFMCSALLPF
ncbi:hypothetical protein H0H93_005989 [Arthromyces matolae]|nr:hypothetical protein H0H93_005989 [Arthromyces matolae]